jgi:hypothetical protein
MTAQDAPAAVCAVCAAVCLVVPLVASRFDPAITPVCRWIARHRVAQAVVVAFGVHVLWTVLDERTAR